MLLLVTVVVCVNRRSVRVGVGVGVRLNVVDVLGDNVALMVLLSVPVLLLVSHGHNNNYILYLIPLQQSLVSGLDLAVLLRVIDGVMVVVSVGVGVGVFVMVMLSVGLLVGLDSPIYSGKIFSLT